MVHVWLFRCDMSTLSTWVSRKSLKHICILLQIMVWWQPWSNNVNIKNDGFTWAWKHLPFETNKIYFCQYFILCIFQNAEFACKWNDYNILFWNETDLSWCRLCVCLDHRVAHPPGRAALWHLAFCTMYGSTMFSWVGSFLIIDSACYFTWKMLLWKKSTYIQNPIIRSKHWNQCRKCSA